MKVSELVEKLLELPQDAEIVKYSCDMEKSGVRPTYIVPKLKRYHKETKSTWDRFDGTDYTYKVYVEDADGAIEAVEM